jgi:hypothetical protein
MTAGPGGFVCQWSPDVPQRLTHSEQRRYRRARNDLLAEVAQRMGGGVLVIEA